jgi:uncharacterized protein with PQ loop repeat
VQHQHPHFHARKRKAAKVEPYPSRIFRIAVIDTIVYVVSVASPVLTMPQVYQIYSEGNAAGVSAISWGAYTLFSIPWLLYGVVHKERVLIINNSLWIVMNACVFIGALLY